MLTNVSEESLNALEMDEQSVVVLKSVAKGLWSVYTFYKGSVLPLQHGKKLSSQQLIKAILYFLRDFEVCPYSLNQKTCFLVWHFTAII